MIAALFKAIQPTDILFGSVKGCGCLCSQCFLSFCQEFKRKLISRGTGCLKSCTPYYGVWSFLKSHKSLGIQVWHLWLEKSWRILRHAFNDYRYLWEVGNVSLWGEGPGPLLLGLESRTAEDLSLDSWGVAELQAGEREEAVSWRWWEFCL